MMGTLNSANVENHFRVCIQEIEKALGCHLFIFRVYTSQWIIHKRKFTCTLIFVDTALVIPGSLPMAAAFPKNKQDGQC